MKWFNHTLIAGAPCALIAPVLVPVAILGATAPDWLEWVARAIRQPVKHRGPTHWLAVWLVLVGVAFLLPDPARGILAAFAAGGASHCLTDAMTVTGIPFSPYSDRRFHLLGGRLRTGSAGEYGVSFGMVILCWLLAGQMHQREGYVPFFPDWGERYARGEATAKEWRDNRFKLF